MTSTSALLNNSVLSTSDLHAVPATSTSVLVDSNPSNQTRDLLQLNSRLDDILARTKQTTVTLSPSRVTASETYLKTSPLRYSAIDTTSLRKSNAEIKSILKSDSPTYKAKTVTFASPVKAASSLTYLDSSLHSLPGTYAAPLSTSYLSSSYVAAPVTTSYVAAPVTTSYVTAPVTTSYATNYATSYAAPATTSYSYVEKPLYTSSSAYTASTIKTSPAKAADYKYTKYEPTTYTATRVTASPTYKSSTYTASPTYKASTITASPTYKTSTYTATRVVESPKYTPVVETSYEAHKVVEPASYLETKVVHPPTYETRTVLEKELQTQTVLEPYTYTTTKIVEPNYTIPASTYTAPTYTTSYAAPSTYTSTRVVESPKKVTSLNDLSYSYRPSSVSYESTYRRAASPTISPSRYTTYETTKTAVSPSKLKYDKDRLDNLISRIQTTKTTYSPVRAATTYSPTRTASYSVSNYAPLSTSYVPVTTPLITSAVSPSSYLYTGSSPLRYSSTNAAPYASTYSSAPYYETERVKSTSVGKSTTAAAVTDKSHVGRLENDVESMTFDDVTGEAVRTRKTAAK